MFGSEVHEFQKAQRERILGCYGNADSILKSETAEDAAAKKDDEDAEKKEDGESASEEKKEDGEAGS